MAPTADTSAQAAAVDFARRIVPFWQAPLGPELLGVYLIGSLAHGGFSRRYSDIDMALITEAGLPPQTLNRVRSQAAAVSADWGAKLSVFWTDRHFGVGRFPPLDRIDYIDHAVVLMERECVRPVRPALEEARDRGAPADILCDLSARALVLLQLDDWPHGLERRGRGVSWQNTPRAARRELDHPRAAMSTGRRRSRFSISCANDAAVSG